MSERLTRGDLPHWYQPGHPHFVTYRLAASLPVAVLRQLRREREQRLGARVPDGQDATRRREDIHKLMFDKYDRLLDVASGVRWLADERVATVVRGNLYHHHGGKYELLAYCIMPNHVHVVFQPFETALARLSDAGSVGHGSDCHLGDSGSVRKVADAASVRDEGVADAACVGDQAVDSEYPFETADNQSVLSRIMHSLKSYTSNRANELLNRSGPFWQKESYDHWVRSVDELERIVSYVAMNPVRAGLCAEPHQWRFSSAHDRFQCDGSRCALVGTLRDDWRR